MKKALSKVLLTALLTTFTFSTNAFANDELLKKVPQLQETARKANRGGLGCGDGVITLVTSNGEIKVGVGLDPLHVFGGIVDKIVVKDLIFLLEKRSEAKRTGKPNPMSGNVSDLAFVILDTISVSKDSDAVPAIIELLEDDDEVIRGWSAIALYRLAKSGNNLQKIVEKVQFPKTAVQSAKARGYELPEWAKMKTD